MRTVVVMIAAITVFSVTAADAAAPTFSVRAGSATAGTTVAFSGTSSKVTLGATSGFRAQCTASVITGTTKVGHGLAGGAILVVDGNRASFSNCTAGGVGFAVTGSGTWKVNASSGDTSGVSGRLTGFTLKLASSSCTFTVSGRLTATYTNSTRVLHLSGPVPVSGVSGCFGVVANGDQLPFDASYTLSAGVAADNPIRLTRP